MTTTIELHDSWTVTGYGPGGEVVGPIPATVPGHVHVDLLAQGLIPDPGWRDQALQSQWVEDYDWEYATTFSFSGEHAAADATLRFEGLDTFATVSVNGTQVGSADNMFLSYAFDLRESLREGSNTLSVRFTSIRTINAQHDMDRYESLFSDDRVYIRRMQCTFGWDWVHRLVSYGIWRPAWIEIAPGGRIDNVWVRTLEVSEGAAQLEWEVAATTIAPARLELELCAPDGRLLWAEQVAVTTPTAAGHIEVPDPQLWWPAGYGDAALHTFRTRLTTADGNEIDTSQIAVGIRTVAVEQLPDERGATFTVVVNGERIFAKGGNWVPADPFPSQVTPERYETLLRSVVEGNMNMLRVWGGGTYELPAFWAACDRLGIMVSLDFMMACAQYPEDQDWFLDAFAVEAEHAITSLRSHPSLIFWSGNNELGMNNSPDDDYWGKVTSERVTAPLCARLDPSRPYFPTSPYGGDPLNSQDAGDVHISSWYDPGFFAGDMRDTVERISQLRGRFVSEAAIPGAPPMASLLRMMTPEDIADEAGDIWEFRTKDNPYNGIEGGLTHHQMLRGTARAMFGRSADVATTVARMEYVQHEICRLEAGHYRRRKYDSSGLLFWMYDDCWPASGWALVDHFGVRKAGWYGASKGFEPLSVTLTDAGEGVELWVVNDTRARWCGSIELVSAAATAATAVEVRARVDDVTVAPNEPQLVRTFSRDELGLAGVRTDVVVQARWRTAPEVEECWPATGVSAVHLSCPPAELALSPATLVVAVDAVSSTLEISTDRFARVVTVHGDGLEVAENYIDLLPGQTHSIRYRWSGAAAGEEITVSAWNSPEQVVDAPGQRDRLPFEPARRA